MMKPLLAAILGITILANPVAQAARNESRFRAYNDLYQMYERHQKMGEAELRRDIEEKFFQARADAQQMLEKNAAFLKPKQLRQTKIMAELSDRQIRRVARHLEKEDVLRREAQALNKIYKDVTAQPSSGDKDDFTAETFGGIGDTVVAIFYIFVLLFQIIGCLFGGC